MDECSLGTIKCSTGAVCTNTKGSYSCTCKPGFSGNGRNCVGKLTQQQQDYLFIHDMKRIPYVTDGRRILKYKSRTAVLLRNRLLLADLISI